MIHKHIIKPYKRVLLYIMGLFFFGSFLMILNTLLSNSEISLILFLVLLFGIQAFINWRIFPDASWWFRIINPLIVLIGTFSLTIVLGFLIFDFLNNYLYIHSGYHERNILYHLYTITLITNAYTSISELVVAHYRWTIKQRAGQSIIIY